MDRRRFLSSIACAILTAPLGVEAQQATKVPRIGVLWPFDAPSRGSKPIVGPFDQGLRDLGWVEGQNIAIERRYAENQPERFPALAADLVRLKVDVILPGGGPASLKAAREATKTIPIVMVASSTDPVGQGLIKSFARPGGNITGLVTAPHEIWGKRFELLKEAVPALSRVGVLWDATLGIPWHRVKGAWEEATRSSRVALLPVEVSKPTDLDHAISALKDRVDGLFVMGTPMFVRHRAEISDLVMKYRLPAVSEWRDFPEAGLLMAYGASRPELFRQAAAYVDKILRGANPGDLPVERPTKFEFIINLKTAKALGLTVPQSLLLRADEVIQ